mmetsp:Transcript_33230/g.54858  ORF Transcript_33230/g.54858 Transcript_33230/m.54858 type:complete len:190 (+) Transcript_33230:14-583(+)
MMMLRSSLFLLLTVLVSSHAKPIEPHHTPAVQPSFLLGTRKELIVLPSGGAKKEQEKEETTITSSITKLTTANVIKAHGYCSLMFAVIFALESFGIKVPLIGPTATVKGYVASDEVIKFFSRYVASFLIYVGFTEIELGSNETVQKYFKIYHIPAAIAAIKLASTNAKGDMGWVMPIVIVGFGVTGLLI